jgi:hypothetical protein
MTIAQQLNIKTKEFPFEIKDNSGNIIYTERVDRYWIKKEYDYNGSVIYCEDSIRGIIKDRVPEYTMEELVNQLGFNFKIKK